MFICPHQSCRRNGKSTCAGRVAPFADRWHFSARPRVGKASSGLLLDKYIPIVQDYFLGLIGTRKVAWLLRSGVESPIIIALYLLCLTLLLLHPNRKCLT